MMMSTLIAALFAVALLILGVFGTGLRLVYHWPVLGVLGVCLVLGLWVRRARAFEVSRIAVASTLLLAAYVLARAATSPIPYAGRMDACLLAGCLGVYLLFVFVLHENRGRLLALGGLIVLGLANTAVALYQRLVDPRFSVFHVHDEKRPLPGSGLYFNYNHMAGFTELVALLCFAMALFGRGGARMRLAFGSAGVACGIGVLASMSRGGFLSLATGLVTLGAIAALGARRFHWPAAARRALLAAGAMAFAGFLAAGIHLIGKRFEEQPKTGAETGLFEIGFTNRLENWRLALRQWDLAPVWGTGSGTYDEYSIRLWRGDWHRPDRIFHPVHAHNDYLQMLAEYGVIGLALVLAVLALHAAYGFAGLRGWMRTAPGGAGPPGNTRMALVAGAFCCLLAYCVHSVVDFNMRLLSSAVVIAFCLALLATAGRRRKETREARPEAFAWAGRIAGAALGLALAVAAARALQPEIHAEKLRQALAEDRIDDALAFGAIAARSEPRNHLLYRHLGDARMRYADQVEIPALRSGFLRSAAEAFRAGVALNPGDSHANVLLGHCLEALGEDAAAEKAFQAALEWDPFGGESNGSYGEFILARGLERFARGDNRRALDALGEALEYLNLSIQASATSDTWQHAAWRRCRDALHEVHSAIAQQRDEEAQSAEASGDTDRARLKYAEAMAAYMDSLGFKPTGAPETAEEVRRYHEIQAYLNRAQALP